MSVCAWAACKVKTGLTFEDGWLHCAEHLKWHRAMQAGKEPGGSFIARDWHYQPHGTVAAARRHLRNGEKPCLACSTATRVDGAARRGVKR